jgi:hypothetical protein
MTGSAVDGLERSRSEHRLQRILKNAIEKSASICAR